MYGFYSICKLQFSSYILSHIQDDKVKQELADLDDKTLDAVMCDAIGKLFEYITSRGNTILSIRNRLRWEIVG